MCEPEQDAGGGDSTLDRALIHLAQHSQEVEQANQRLADGVAAIAGANRRIVRGDKLTPEQHAQAMIVALENAVVMLGMTMDAVAKLGYQIELTGTVGWYERADSRWVAPPIQLRVVKAGPPVYVRAAP